MKRWTMKELEDTSDLEFAACILNERAAHLNPYTPLAQKLERVKSLLQRMSIYLLTSGKPETQTADKALGVLRRDGYLLAATMIENMIADRIKSWRENDLLNRCFSFLEYRLPKDELLQVLKNDIGLTDEEICEYTMSQLLEDQDNGKEKI